MDSAATSLHIIGLYHLTAIIAIPGLFGGFISGLFEMQTFELREKTKYFSRNKRDDKWVFYVTRSLIGVAGAFGTFLLAIWLEKIGFEPTTQNEIKIVSLCLIGGSIAFKSLPKIGNYIENQLVRQLNEVEERTERAMEQQELSLKYSSAIVDAQTALSKKDLIDVDRCIEQLERIKENYTLDRRLNIYLGRLYRRKGDFIAGIMVLKKYVKALDNRKTDEHEPYYIVDRSDALYNIACYHALMAKEADEQGQPNTEIQRLKSEALTILRQSIEEMGGNPINREWARDEDDFGFIKDMADFELLTSPQPES